MHRDPEDTICCSSAKRCHHFLVGNLFGNAAGHQLPWTEFRAAFRAHHIPSSVMRIKLREFMALKQGSKTVREYVQVFNDLARYAPTHVDTDTKKRECFLEGMSPKLRSRLGRCFQDFNQLVDD